LNDSSLLKLFRVLQKISEPHGDAGRKLLMYCLASVAENEHAK